MKKHYIVNFDPYEMVKAEVLEIGWYDRSGIQNDIHDWIVKQCESVSHPIVARGSIKYIFLDKLYADMTYMMWNKYISDVVELENDFVLHTDYYNLDTEKHPDVEGSFF